MKKTICFLGLVFLILLASNSHADTIVASSCSRSDVAAAVSASSDDDTILIPDGSCTWTSGITISKQIKIKAQNMSSVQYGRTNQSVVITNNISSESNPLFSFTTGNTYHQGIAGIRFLSGSSNHIRVEGSGRKPILIEDISVAVNTRFGQYSASDSAVISFRGLGGIIWNSRFVGVGTYGVEGNCLWVSSARSWDTPSTMGMLDTNGNINVYVEDSYLKNAGMHTVPDVDVRGRFVMRHCIMDGSNAGTHGNTSKPNEGRHVEFYDNVFQVTTYLRNIAGRYFWMRAGTGVFTDNEVNCDNVEYGDNKALDLIWEGTGGYPQSHQTGWGHDGNSAVIDPIYMWNQTGDCAYKWDNSSSSYIRENREIYINNGAKPGYTKYTYPHPLRDGTGPDTTPPTLDGTGPDTTPPTVTSAEVQTDGISLYINFSENVTFNDTTGFSISGAEGDVQISTCSGLDSNTLNCGLTDYIHDTDAGITIVYSGTPADAIEDAANNDLAEITAPQSVTNSSGLGTTQPLPKGNTGIAQPLPEGNTGIASNYVADSGIENHADVIFFDDFEPYSSLSQLSNNWDHYYESRYLSISTNSADVYSGNQSIEMVLPVSGSEVSNELVKNLIETVDTLHVRFYAKYNAGYNILGTNHNGCWISANYLGAGIPADGTNHFLGVFESARYESEVSPPGELAVYLYHPGQRDKWGDHFYPDGIVRPYISTPFDFGPDFIPRSDVIPEVDTWACYEMMIKANTPGLRDGRIALWKDGVLIADFLNLRLRDTDTLKIDNFTMVLHSGGNSGPTAKKWYDNVVAATSYIGPMMSSLSQGNPPKAPTGLEIVNVIK